LSSGGSEVAAKPVQCKEKAPMLEPLVALAFWGP
jgi:hypothetical protein